MSDNVSSIIDEDGDFNDWIELYNNSNNPINLLDFSLSDESNDLNKWRFPDVIIPPHSFLLIFASGKDKLDANELHTNFKISSDGEPLYLTNKSGQLIDQLPPVPLTENDSYGRSPDGSNNLFLLIHSSPSSSNDINNQLSFEHQSGFYNKSFFQKITSITSDTIHYTIDGSNPDKTSSIFLDSILIENRSPLENNISNIPTTPEQSLISYKAWEAPDHSLDKVNILKYATFKNGMRTSEIYTHTYIVDSNIFQKYEMPIVSLITDNEHLFNYETGIYVPGINHDPDDPAWTGNYFQRGEEWERPVHIEYFEKDGSLGFAQNAGIRIHGGKTRQGAQKSFKLYARDEYGKKHFDYQLMPHRQNEKYKRFLLQTTFGSWENAVISDVLSHEIARKIGIDYLDYRPVIVFLNGEYWGIHTVRDKIDERYIAYSNNLNEDSVEIRGFYSVPYLYLTIFLESNDMTDDENYDYVKTKLDIDNFIDYHIIQMYLKNFDWPANNIDAWKEKKEEGKWKWLFYDIDAAFGNYRYNMFEHMTETDSTVIWPNSLGSTSVFRNLMTNEQFRDQFINRYAELLNNDFQPDSILEKLDQIVKLYEPEMSDHIKRWNYLESISNWKKNIDEGVISFIINRPCQVEKNLTRFFDLSSFDFQCIDDISEEDVLLLAPNPNNGELFIYNNQDKYLVGDIIITNIIGQVVFVEEDVVLFEKEKNYFDFSSLSNNTYIFVFRNEDFSTTKKFVIMK